ncbi:methionyl-tRNA formyltransferase [Candidatus Shapirobacteria bacterium CG10_big_fil_rev_8_21_14_0_10_38_8]|nr:MAG: methionyl-tRNA formyltransferase [Candidatus Shapirobacteria bacterium CG10_big_fil_rev_8_21_14_0_10_38_8]
MIKVVFFGTPDFVIPILDSILQVTRLDLVSVVTNPDRPVGRKQILTPTPVKKWAVKHNIPVLTPEIVDDNFKFQISNFKFDLGVLAAYGKILPSWLIDLFPQGILVIHPSLLPKYRGASPVQAAILNGDKETGVSIIKMDEKMDHGPIIHQFKIPINPDETTASLLEKSFNQTAKILPEIIKRSYSFYPDRGLKSNKQDDKQATYTKLIKKEDGFIPWKTLEKAKKADGIEIERFIRAMTPWPGVWTINPQTQKRLKILKARLENEKLIVDEVQWEGRKPTSGLPVLS